jgi:hypothetical protein
MHLLKQPFRWWWLIWAALVPGRLVALGKFALRLSGGVPSRLDGVFTPRLTHFCVAISDRSRMTWMRCFVGATRSIALLALGALVNAVTWEKGVFSRQEDRWFPLMLAGVLIGCWLVAVLFTAARKWLECPEEPVCRYPLLRMGFIPLLVLAGLLLNRVSAPPILGQVLILPVALLAWMRFQKRNPRHRVSSSIHPLVGSFMALYALVLVLAVVVVSPLASAGTALSLWLADLLCQGNQLRPRHQMDRSN